MVLADASDSLTYLKSGTYGLHVELGEKGKRRLTRLYMLPPDNYSDLYQVTQAALPSPLVRALQQNPMEPSGSVSSLRTAAVRELRVAFAAKLVQAQTLVQSQAKRNKAQVDPITLLKSGYVPLSLLTGRENSALAVALITGALPEIVPALLRSLPPAYSHAYLLCLTGGVYQDGGKQKFQLFFAFPSADGKSLVPGPGVGGMDFPNVPDIMTTPNMIDMPSQP